MEAQDEDACHRINALDACNVSVQCLSAFWSLSLQDQSTSGCYQNHLNSLTVYFFFIIFIFFS